MSTAGGIGAPADRVDARLKVTGGARFTAEVAVNDVAHAVIVPSRIAAGTVVEVATAAARAMPGVLAVLTHENVPRLEGGVLGFPELDKMLLLMQDRTVQQDGQPVAVVVAETPEQAREAAERVEVRYERERPRTSLAEVRDQAESSPDPLFQALWQAGSVDVTTGDPDAALRDAEVTVDATYVTPGHYQNPMEPHATVAVWDGDLLTLYDSTQAVFEVRRKVATALGVPAENVRVVSTYVGGGFGSKLHCWGHVVLAAVAARAAGRPVKLVLDRSQMFRTTGGRPRTEQRLQLGADREGRLVAVVHDVLNESSMFDLHQEQAAVLTRMLYRCPSMRTTHRFARLHIGTPSFMRAPGEAVGSFALESAMDELAATLDVDPLELRLRNHADVNPTDGRPFSSKSLLACYETAAARFGWRDRARPGGQRDGQWRLGWGMATSSYPTVRFPASALVRVSADGSALVACGSQDMGTGTYTVASQVAASGLGIPLDRVRCLLGDTALPVGPVSGESNSAASVGSAVHEAATGLRRRLIELATHDAGSALQGADPDDVRVEDGRLSLASDPERADTYAELLARNWMGSMEHHADTAPGAEMAEFSMHAFGAHFVEVRVDADLGLVRVSRIVSAFSAGTILNPKTARSQLLGGITFGIGMALLEETITDRASGRMVNANFADYAIPVHADVPTVEVLLVPEEDAHVNPLGVKGIGELGIVGCAAAIANAVHDATGQRIRRLPITAADLLVRRPAGYTQGPKGALGTRTTASARRDDD